MWKLYRHLSSGLRHHCFFRETWATESSWDLPGASLINPTNRGSRYLICLWQLRIGSTLASHRRAHIGKHLYLCWRISAQMGSKSIPEALLPPSGRDECKNTYRNILKETNKCKYRRDANWFVIHESLEAWAPCHSCRRFTSNYVKEQAAVMWDSPTDSRI